MLNPFTPGATATLAVTATTSNVALPAGYNFGQVMITNAPDSSTAFISFGDDAVVATVAASTPILPSAAYTFTIGPDVTHMAGICAGAGTATVYVTRGQGE